jgi:putative FmdB family regulatory protein
MPMYEFFCSDCNTVFTFFSRTVNTEKVPPCPKCRREGLRRMVSRFAVTGRAGVREDAQEGPEPPVDGARMEKAMEALASEAAGVDENNPRAAAGLMRRFSDMTGVRFGDKMENALTRLEAGDDPESLEKDLEGLDENDLFRVDGAGGGAEKRTTGRKRPPQRDETLYEM